MRKILAIGLGVLLLILIGWGVYVFFQESKELELVNISDTSIQFNTPEEEDAYATPETEDQNRFQGTLKELLQSGRSAECTFSKNDGRGDAHGVLYVSGGKMRGEFVLRAAGSPAFESYAIYDGTMAYVWHPEEETGTVFRIDAENLDQYTTQGGSVSLNERFEFTCAPWTPRGGEFTLPSDIEFSNV